LTTRTPEQRDLVFSRTGINSGGVGPGDHARVLLHRLVVTSRIEHCTLPETQALSVVVWLAGQQHGSPQDERWRADDPADRAVPRTKVIDLLAGSDEDLRAAAGATLDALADVALVLPPHGEQVIVPTAVHLHLSGGIGLGRPADRLMAAYFNAAEVHKIANGLGFPKAPNRDAAQRNVVGFLTDPERVRALLAEAPEPARRWVTTIARQGPRVRTYAFQCGDPYGYNPNGKFAFSPYGSGNPDID
jgi:hypothetical protein